MNRYVLIGCGVASISAAEVIRANDPQGELVMLGDDPHGYYSRPGLAYLLTGEVPERLLFPFKEEDFRRLRLPRRQAKAAAIDRPARQVLLEDGSCLPYDCLLIATGAQALRTEVPGADLEGVVKLDNLEDARHILRLSRRARNAVVVGGGITALEIVEGLAAHKVHTHYLLRGDRYWGNVLDESESRLVEHHLLEQGVELHFQSELAEIVGRKGRVSGVLTRQGQLIPCEVVGVAIGVRPRKELAESAGLKTERGILVDECMQTSDPYIFAAGDVAQVVDRRGRSSLDCLWSTARETGQVAGACMSGPTRPYSKKLAFNVTRLGGLTTIIIGSVGGGRDSDVVGIARGDSELWREKAEAQGVEVQTASRRLRVMVGKQTLAGAVLIGDQALSEPLQNLVSGQVDIGPIRERLLHPQTDLGPLLTAFWQEWKETHAALQP
jgi:NAD(P)H-nitrite reductase large subunit